jgi:hypothetical protein
LRAAVKAASSVGAEVLHPAMAKAKVRAAARMARAVERFRVACIDPLLLKNTCFKTL